MPAKTGIRVVLMAFLAAGSAFSVAQAQGIGLQPASVEMEVGAGARMRKVVTLANVDREKPVSVSLSLADWTQDEAGTVSFGAVEDTGASAVDWVLFSPMTVSLAPGQTKQVALDLAAPKSLSRTGDYRFALVAATVVQDPAGAWKKQQTASLFYLTAGEAASRPRIAASRLTVATDGQPAIGLDFSNTGNAHARLQGTIEVSGDGGAAFSVPVGEIVVLDGAARSVTIPLGQSLPANPVIEVRLENVFAPQKDDERQALKPHRVNTETKVADLAVAVAGQD
ncbi:MAG: hypothetical protein R3C08_11970 [Hyphomonas sp.]